MVELKVYFLKELEPEPEPEPEPVKLLPGAGPFLTGSGNTVGTRWFNSANKTVKIKGILFLLNYCTMRLFF